MGKTVPPPCPDVPRVRTGQGGKQAGRWERAALGTALLLGLGQIGWTSVAAAAAYGQATDTVYTVNGDTLTAGGGKLSEDSLPNLTEVYGNISATGNGSHIVPGTGGSVNPNDINASGTGYTLTLADGTYTLGVAYGAYTKDQDAENNVVTINGGTINEVYGGFSSAASANNNTVTIKAGTSGISVSSIYAGDGFAAAANNNTVNILTPVTLVGPLYGGRSNNSSGNTLNVSTKNSTARQLGYFQHLNFYLPSDIADGETMLTVTGASVSFDSNTTIGAAALNGVSLEVGDTVTLLSVPDYSINDISDGALTNNLAGNISFLTANNLAVDTKYALALTKTTNAITATVTSKTAEAGGGDSSGDDSGGDTAQNQRVKSTVETRMASLGLLNSNADMLAGAGFDKAAEAVRLAREEDGGEPGQGGRDGIWMEKPEAANYFVPYAVTNGFNLRHQSGSHVDSKGFGLSLGFSRELKNQKGTLLVAPFVEYCNGKYDSYQDNGLHANGNSRAYGFGVMAQQTNHDGLYYEGSLRFGRVKSDYNSQLSTVAHADYDSSSNYWAAHLGLGKITALKGDNSLNCYLKYFYTHQTGDDVTININGNPNDHISFDAVDSHRLRLGARLSHKLDENSSFYGGLAYQYEFGGEARATYHGEAAPSPSVKGSSGMLELGAKFQPAENLRMDFTLAGWVGKQRGVTGQLGMNWTF